MRLAEVDQVDGTSHGYGEFVDQLDAGVGGERHGGAHGKVKVAVRLPSRPAARELNSMAMVTEVTFQDRGNGGPDLGIRFIPAASLHRRHSYKFSYHEKPSAMQAKADRFPPLAGHLQNMLYRVHSISS
ncbi:MAG: hypothetical protein MRJ92_02330 [Nitrospira sp.]|nr:hypothetical protein [Nitrospira sp.]